MNTETGRYRLLDTYYPSKSPASQYMTLFAATTAAMLRNIATGQPHRYIVRSVVMEAVEPFRSIGAL
jgi:hypothetical protein